MPTNNHIFRDTLDDMKKKYINEAVWPMLDEMRCMLIRFVNESIVELYPGLISGTTEYDFTDKLLGICINHICGRNINTYWHDYGKKRNEYIVRTFNNLLSYGYIRGLQCLVKFIRVMESRVVQSINVEEISRAAKNMSIRKFRAHTKCITAKGVDEIISAFKRSNAPIRCPTNGICSEYDGKDCYINGYGIRVG